MNEDKLVVLLKAGDEQAFKQLVETYQRMVINTCFGFMHNEEIAEDLSQEVFIQVFHSIQNFRSDAKLSTWLYRIAVNKCLNELRKKKNKSWLQKAEDLIFDDRQAMLADVPKNQPLHILENKERANMLHEAINKLPDNQKTAFTLSKYRNLPNKEIANIMNMSLSAIEALQNRAKKNLQKFLLYYYKKN